MEQNVQERIEQLFAYRNEKRWDELFPLAEKLAEEGYLVGLGMLGECYLIGSGVPQDEKRGLEILLEAANHQDVYAQEILGDYYCGCDFNGVFINEEQEAHKDYAEMVIWYTRAARAGSDYAQRRIDFICYRKQN